MACGDFGFALSLLSGEMSEVPLTRYRTANWSSYNAALKKRGSLTVWFDPSMLWEGLASRTAAEL